MPSTRRYPLNASLTALLASCGGVERRERARRAYPEQLQWMALAAPDPEDHRAISSTTETVAVSVGRSEQGAVPKAKGGADDDTAGGADPVVANPRRISARMTVTLGDVAQIGQANFEAALRQKSRPRPRGAPGAQACPGSPRRRRPGACGSAFRALKSPWYSDQPMSSELRRRPVDAVYGGTARPARAGSDWQVRGIWALVLAAVVSHPAAAQPISADDVLVDAAPDAAAHLARLDALGDAAEDGSRIDVLVAYTPTVVERGSGLVPTEALIDLLVERTNRAYRDSGVIQRINLVSAVEVDYRETGDNYADLARAIDPSDGHMDELHEIRQREAADIVALLAYHPDSRVALAGGSLSEELAFILFSLGPGNWPDYSRFPDWMGATFAHELGHVMGLRHDRYTLQAAGVDLRRLQPPYSVGYVNQAAFRETGKRCWWTIMSYSAHCEAEGLEPDWTDNTVILRFSNPDQRYEGDPLGVAGEEASARVDGPADARRALNENRRIVANFRVSTTPRARPFTDDPIRPGVTPIRAVHFTELRERIDALRTGAGLARFAWTDARLIAGVTPVRLAHLLELREALGSAYVAAGRPVPRWSDVEAGSTPIRAAHLTELRAAVLALE